MLLGSCLCQAIRFQVEGKVSEAHHCHCSRCRKAHGAAFATYGRVSANALRILVGEDQLASFRVGPVSRQFCSSCGSNLFFKHEGAKAWLWIAASAFEDGRAVNPTAHSFFKSRAEYWSIEDSLPRYDEQRPDILAPAPER